MMFPQTITVLRGFAGPIRLAVSLVGDLNLDLAGAGLTLYCKRFPWQRNDESFKTLTLEDGLTLVESREVADSGAIVDIRFAAADTVAFPIGNHVWELWMSREDQTIPVSHGMLSVPVSPLYMPNNVPEVFSTTLTIERTWMVVEGFDSPAGLAEWLEAEGISPADYAQILENLGYTPHGEAVALESGALSALKILEEYKKL